MAQLNQANCNQNNCGNGLRKLKTQRVYIHKPRGIKKKKLHILQTLCSSPNLKSSIFTLNKKNGENKYGTWKTFYKISTSNNSKTKNSVITFNPPLTTTSDLEFSLLKPTKHVEFE